MYRNQPFQHALTLLLWLASATGAAAIEIVIDYSYDTENFFDTQLKRDVLRAAADRYSRVITSSLAAVSPQDSTAGWRIGSIHPGTGNERWQLSTATSADTDPINSEPADVYGFPGLKQDEWLLYAGGRDLASAGVGGTGTGLNFLSVLDDLNGPMHRGLITNAPEDRPTQNDLPTWGGSISFDTGTDWHFDLTTASASREIDFYSIALHEIGHALGLNTTWNQWEQLMRDDQFLGREAVAAYNRDHDASIAQLRLQPGDSHWRDDTYDSFVFPFAAPLKVGTVADGQMQDLLLEPTTNFRPGSLRFELTNVDAAALKDIGWSIVEPPMLDLDVNGSVDGIDLDLACGARADLSSYLQAVDSLVGDVDLDGQVQFSDFLRLSTSFGQTGAYSQGDLDCDGDVQFGDFLILANHFGRSAAMTAAVPEPAAASLFWLALIGLHHLVQHSVFKPRWPNVG